jgi:vacuolar-type H+-ATPase subunit F/Vma7
MGSHGVSWRVRVIASPAVATGFRLAGLTADAVSNPRDAADRLIACAADPSLGILLVEQPLLDAVPDVVRRTLERRAIPILVPIPVPAWASPASGAESFILELLRRAIGYRVRLQ